MEVLGRQHFLAYYNSHVMNVTEIYQVICNTCALTSDPILTVWFHYHCFKQLAVAYFPRYTFKTPWKAPQSSSCLTLSISATKKINKIAFLCLKLVWWQTESFSNADLVSLSNHRRFHLLRNSKLIHNRRVPIQISHTDWHYWQHKCVEQIICDSMY